MSNSAVIDRLVAATDMIRCMDEERCADDCSNCQAVSVLCGVIDDVRAMVVTLNKAQELSDTAARVCRKVTNELV